MASNGSDAWLFDACPHPRTSHIVFWIKHGASVTKRLVPYQPTFCIQAYIGLLTTAEALLAKDIRVERVWRDRRALWLRGPLEEILCVQPKRLQDLHSVATVLRRRTHTKGFLFYDVDHAVESRWMHEQGLWSMCRLRLDANGAPPERVLCEICRLRTLANPASEGAGRKKEETMEKRWKWSLC